MRKETTSISLEKRHKDALRELAGREDRTLSDYLRRLIMQHLRDGAAK